MPMPPYRDYTEWRLLKDRLDKSARPVDDEHDCNDSIEDLFDAAIRHRFGILISQAKLKLKAQHR
jgi:hypothetical protein